MRHGLRQYAALPAAPALPIMKKRMIRFYAPLPHLSARKADIFWRSPMRMHALLVSVLLASPVLAAGVKVENAWMREPAPGQAVVGGFLDLTSDRDASLVGASSPAAGKVELHEMKRQGDLMQMRALQKIDLPKGKTVRLEPGGLHLMLSNPRKPLKAGDKVPLTLTVKSGGKVEKVDVTAEVRSLHAPGHAPMHDSAHSH